MSLPGRPLPIALPARTTVIGNLGSQVLVRGRSLSKVVYRGGAVKGCAALKCPVATLALINFGGMPDRQTEAEALARRRGIVGVIAAVFAAVASAVNAVSGPLWLKLALAAIAVVSAGIALILFRRETAVRHKDDADKRAYEHSVATAVELLALPNKANAGTLAIVNVGPCVVTRISVASAPASGRSGSPPRITRREQDGVKYVQTAYGDWFDASVDHLDPGESGPILIDFEFGPGDNTVVWFRVAWNDHTGKRRTSVAEADIASTVGTIDLTPREPMVIAP